MITNAFRHFGSFRTQRFLFSFVMTVFFFGFITVQLSRAGDKSKSQSLFNNDLTTSYQITDPQLLGLIGKWDGVSVNGTDTAYVAMDWKLTENGQWMEGKIRHWTSNTKKARIPNETIYIRPTDSTGIYKSHAFGEDGVARVGRAMASEGIWHWTWAYDNGCLEKSRMSYFGQGKIFYEGTVTDAVGNQIAILNYDLTRPVILSYGNF